MNPYDDLAAKARAALTEEAQLTADGYGAEALTMMLRSQRRDLATGVLALLADLRAARARVEKMERVVKAARACKHRTDSGWRLPSVDEWIQLMVALDALETP
jgi:hypothetical protein